MSVRDGFMSHPPQVHEEVVRRALALARHLLGKHDRHPSITPHDVVRRAYAEILDGLHDDDYDPNALRFVHVVVMRIVSREQHLSPVS